MRLRAPSPAEYQRMTRDLRIAVAEATLATTDAARARQHQVGHALGTTTRLAAEALLATLPPEHPVTVARRHAEIEAACAAWSARRKEAKVA